MRPATVLALCAALCAITLAGCSSPRATRQGATRTPEASSRDEVAFREMFDETVPSIEAVLPLALVVDNALVTDTTAFITRAWFSARKPVCMKMLSIEAGDTTSTDDFYYRDGRLVAWAKMVRGPDLEHQMREGVTRALFGPNGSVRWVEMSLNGTVLPRRLTPGPKIVKWMTAEYDTGLRALLTRKAERSSRW